MADRRALLRLASTASAYAPIGSSLVLTSTRLDRPVTMIAAGVT